MTETNETTPKHAYTIATRSTVEHPYLRQNYAPVHQEITATELSVTGTIPDYLDGRYLRIGPNPLGDPDPEKYEWFLGAGMVHGLRIENGQAQWYRNRWIRSADVRRTLGEPWPGGPHRGGLDFAANTNIIDLGGRTIAIAEAGARPYELTDELDTIGPSDFGGSLRGGYTAHPKRDPRTGELHAVSYSPLRGNRVQYTVTGADGVIRRAVDIPLRCNTMMHDFSLTEGYVILYDLPVVLDLAALVRSRPAQMAGRILTPWATRHPMPGWMTGVTQRSSKVRQPDFGLPYRWDSHHQARILVMPRNGDAHDIRSFDVEPCFIYHALNAYDDGNRIVLDIARHASAFDNGPEPISGASTLDRWTIDLTAGTVREERRDDRNQDFPRVDERRVGLRHRFGYTIGYSPGADRLPAPDALIKHDYATGAAQIERFGGGREPSEFVFVPSSPDSPEDDGIVMGFVYDQATDRSDLVLLDAQTLESVATVHLPARVPHGFHGNWVPSAG